MMQIHLVHPRHGKKIAMQEKEAEMDKKSGWTEVTKEQFYAPKESAKKTEKEKADHGQDPDLVAQYETVMGKRPHYRVSNDAIRDAINDASA